MMWLLVFTLEDSDIQFTGPQPYATQQECRDEGAKLPVAYSEYPKLVVWDCFEEGHEHHLPVRHHGHR